MRNAGEEGLCFAVVCLIKNIFIDFCQTNYLNIYRTDIYEICRKTLAVDKWFEVIFDPSRDVVVVTNFVGKIDLQYSPCSSRDIR